eukprot:8256375-Lingulodinium_polyedra.AAC.1
MAVAIAIAIGIRSMLAPPACCLVLQAHCLHIRPMDNVHQAFDLASGQDLFSNGLPIRVLIPII